MEEINPVDSSGVNTQSDNIETSEDPTIPSENQPTLEQESIVENAAATQTLDIASTEQTGIVSSAVIAATETDVEPNEEDERSEIDIDFEIAKATEVQTSIDKSGKAEKCENEPIASTATAVEIEEDGFSEIDVDFEIAKAAEREATIEKVDNEPMADTTAAVDTEPNEATESSANIGSELTKTIESETIELKTVDAAGTPVSDEGNDVTLETVSTSSTVGPADVRNDGVEVQNEGAECAEMDVDVEITSAAKSEAKSEATTEKCHDEPMDIDEILDSLNTDQDVVSSSEDIINDLQCPVEEQSQTTTTLDIENAVKSSGKDIDEREKSPITAAQTEEEVIKSDELPVTTISANKTPDEHELPTTSSTDAVDEVTTIQRDCSSINLEKSPAQQQEREPSPEKTGEEDLQITPSSVTKEDNNEAAIEPIDETNEATLKTPEQTSKPIQEPTNDKNDKNEQPTVTESVDFFDLLLENQDLFGQTEANENEQQKLDDIQTETSSDTGTQKTDDIQTETSSDIETEHIVETYKKTEDVINAESEPEKVMDKVEPMEVEDEKASLRKECLNVDCLKKSETFYEAPEFVINHFHLNKRQKVFFVCEYCYDSVTEAYGELCAALVDKQPLFSHKIKYTDLVEIIDSSDEEDDDKSVKNDKNSGNNCQQFDENTLALIESELEAVIAETFKKVDIDQQMEWNRQILANQIDENEENCMEMMKEMKGLQQRIDKLYTNTYSFRHSFIEEVQSLDLQTLKPTQICNEAYPPNGDLTYPDVEYNLMYYTFRKKLTSRWLPCKVIDQVQVNGATEYAVKFCRDKKDSLETKTVPRKHLAYGRCPAFRLNIGVRVIALYDNSRDISSVKRTEVLRNNFLPGVIAEPLCKYTKWRYLIFFDDGYVQYVHHENIRVICEHADNVWELIEEPGAKAFIQDYAKDCKKKRPFVSAQRGNRIQTELAGKWYNAIVNDVDGSVVQMYFEDLKRYDWVYRASTRLFPLYRRLKHVKTVTAAKAEPIIEYIEIDDDKEPERSTEPPPIEEPPQPDAQSSKTTPIQRTFASQAARDTPQQKQREQKRAVAKKSTGNQPKPTVMHMNNSTIYVDEDKPKGKVVYFAVKKPIVVKKYVNHECQPSCLVPVQNLATYSPLSKALLSGFERQICKTRYYNKNKYVVYRAPCGRRLRDMYEMHKYLRMTNCKLNVDNFSFDPLIHCLAEYMIESHVMKKPDLSEGIEKMPVQLVNCYDSTMPPPCVYSAKRIPTEGVNLNLDSEFLCGCDCTDDCLDKTKCACWKLTLAGAKYGNPETPIEDVGYEFKRLNEPVPSGIYECNSRCKCKSNCLNRVVQHPLQLKLQVFKTVNRGWGLRCLNDVPKGSFICCYAGNLLTEASANEAGGDLGDEYFAELDYIEVVENMKEGYEPEVINDDPESSSNDEDFDVEMESMRARHDDSDDEFVAKSYTASEDSESRRYRTRNSVDTRKEPDQNLPKGNNKRKERNSSSDDDFDEEVRQVKSVMASNTMPLNDDPDEEPSKSIRKFFGKNEAVYIMDAKKAGNIGRYFNHSCGPNLFVQNVFVDTHDLRFPWVAFFASTHIRAGTELTWNYNYEVGSVPGKVLICQCGDEKCRGRIL